MFVDSKYMALNKKIVRVDFYITFDGAIHLVVGSLGNMFYKAETLTLKENESNLKIEDKDFLSSIEAILKEMCDS